MTVRLELSEAQAQALTKVADYALSELSAEIARTSRYEFRDHLREERRALEEAAQKLHRASLVGQRQAG